MPSLPMPRLTEPPTLFSDYGADNWRQQCLAKWVRQEDAMGCGIACLAMLSGVPYSEVRQAFISAGLDLARGRKPPYSSNFKELIAVASSTGLQARLRRWNGWHEVEGLGVIKVPTGKPTSHWMVVERTQAFGLVVQDPAIDWPAFERPPLDVLYRRLDAIGPTGGWIEITRVGTQS